MVSVLGYDNVVNKIRSRLLRIVKDYISHREIYDGDIQLYRDGDTYMLKFIASGSSGEATYTTPLCKAPDIYEYVNNEDAMLSLEDYCNKILEVLADLVNEEY